MSDLAAWLSNRLDEVETLAQDIADGKPKWYRGVDVGDYYNFEVVSRESIERYADASSDVVISCGYGDSGRLLADYVAAFDPAMVLRLVAATRALLELHYPNFRYVPMTKDRWIYLSGAEAVAMAARTDEVWKGDLECDVCGDENGGGENPRLPWPCPTLRAVAVGWGWTDE